MRGAGVAARLGLTIALLLASPASTVGQVPGVVRADSLVASWVSQERVPGAVLLVVQDGEVVLERAYGWQARYRYDQGQYGVAAAGRRDPRALRADPSPAAMSPATAFDLASVTKVMATTFAVMLLVDRGEVNLDEPVSAYLADFTGGGKEAVTVRHLLTHRSGMRQWWPVYYHASGPEEAYAFVRDLPLQWPVGEGRHYSDLGFMVLGRLVEAVSGQELARFLQEELYGPLGLERTGWRSPRPAARGEGNGPWAATSHGNPYEHRMVHDSTFGYRIDGDPDAWDGWRLYTFQGEVNDGNAWHAFRGVAGHAGLFSTAAELGVLLRLLLDGGVAGGHRYLEEATIAAFLSDQGEGQALGWQLPAWAPPGSFAHTGFTGTWVLGVPSRRLGVVLLTNRQNLGVGPEGTYPDVAPLQRGVGEALLDAGSPTGRFRR